LSVAAQAESIQIPAFGEMASNITDYNAT
jgi:hypothetical protein